MDPFVNSTKLKLFLERSFYNVYGEQLTQNWNWQLTDVSAQLSCSLHLLLSLVVALMLVFSFLLLVVLLVSDNDGGACSQNWKLPDVSAFLPSPNRDWIRYHPGRQALASLIPSWEVVVSQSEYVLSVYCFWFLTFVKSDVKNKPGSGDTTKTVQRRPCINCSMTQLTSDQIGQSQHSSSWLDHPRPISNS